jgi:hypothetical protein
MNVGDHQVPARTQDTGELGHHRCQRRNVDQRQGADNKVHAATAQRQPVQVTQQELGRHPAQAGTRQHVRRAVHAGNPVPAGGQVLRMPPGAAGRVQRAARRQGAEDLPHDRFLDRDERIARLVVGLRPGPVTIDRADLADL